MKFTRKASANWRGTGKEGQGLVSTESTTLSQANLSYKTRFENGVGTNPEELIAAAHSGCFTMQLSFLLSEEGYTPINLDTEAQVKFENGTITRVHLELEGQVEGINETDFKRIAEQAKEVCPISKLLNTEITLTVSLM